MRSCQSGEDGGSVSDKKKAFNNNAVLVNDEKGLEKILIGRGIAFGKRGDFIVESMIEKTFIVDAPDIKDNFIQLTNDIPVNHLELATKIINDAEESLNYTFDDMNIYWFGRSY